MRVAEVMAGYVRVAVVGDPGRRVLSSLVERGVPLWELRPGETGDYALSLRLSDVRTAVSEARRAGARLRFLRKVGWPFALWRLGRRKAFAAGAVFFAVSLYMLSSFIWTVDIQGTNQQEAVSSALRKLNIYPGGWIYRVLDQDSVQLALLDKLPEISWVGVRIQGTRVEVRVVERIPPAKIKSAAPQDMVAAVPGVIASVLANRGLPMVKPGEYVTAGRTLLSGRLEDGKTVRADGKVEAIVWYRTDVEVPVRLTQNTLTGASVRHDYLVVGGIPIQIWGFSHPPYPHSEVQVRDIHWTVGDFSLPVYLRVDTVYEARARTEVRSGASLLQTGLRFSAEDSLRMAGSGAKVMRQTVLQKKVDRGKLYMTVWTEVLQNIARPRPIHALPAPPGHVPPSRGAP